MISKPLRRELNKLRELIHFLLAGAGASKRVYSETAAQQGALGSPDGPFVCYFCEKEMQEGDFEAHGEATGPKFEGGISIHHVDGNHDNNEISNKALCHTKCHKGFHRRAANALAMAVKRGELG